jgi:uncharacterized membrane protein
MDLRRILRHLFFPPWRLARAFPSRTLGAIENAIAASEAGHLGELRFVAEAGLELLPLLRGQTPRQRAVELFSALRLWDTAQNSGVLIYVQLADRRVEILADRGIAALVPQNDWDAICRSMEEAFRQMNFEAGSLEAVSRINALLRGHFPAGSVNPDELPNRPLLL